MKCDKCGGPMSETQPILFPGLFQCEDGDCANSFMMPKKSLTEYEVLLMITDAIEAGKVFPKGIELHRQICSLKDKPEGVMLDFGPYDGKSEIQRFKILVVKQ